MESRESHMPELNLQLRDPETGELIPQPELSDEEALPLLLEAEITAAELIPWGSNYTYAVALESEGHPGHLAIYKPMAGERPLYDFRHGSLHRRERASYLLSRALGWDIVPPTVVRGGPHGIGSLQMYVPSRPDYMEDHEFWGARTIANERLVLFDHLANNADRKITHCLLSTSGKVVGIDHGLTFHHEPKLRTVLWQFVGQPIHPELLEQLRRYAANIDEHLAMFRKLLSADERDAFRYRLERLISEGHYPILDPHRNIPYGWW
jgi:hypothetical protein